MRWRPIRSDFADWRNERRSLQKARMNMRQSPGSRRRLRSFGSVRRRSSWTKGQVSKMFIDAPMYLQCGQRTELL